MNPTRRAFLQSSLAAGAAAAITPALLARSRWMSRGPDGAAAAPLDPDAWRTPAGSVDPTLGSVKPASTPLKLLVLGGTAFLGPHAVEYALARGHEVTLFNRGKTNPHLFPKLEKLRGDRNDNLKSLEEQVGKGRTWDGVLDTSGYFPRHMDLSCGVLKDAVDRYLFIATINVYKSDEKPNEDEAGELNLELVENGDEKDLRNYGPYKAQCELRADKLMPGKVARVRPALIAGPRDPSDRFTYWPVRMSEAKGERVKVLAPLPQDQRVQYIDARDLARFCITLLENKATGAFNGIGPATPITMAQLLKACAEAAGTNPEMVWATPEQLMFCQVQPWAELPIWVPAQGEHASIHTRNNDKSVQAGLVTRPARDTARDILTWWPGELNRRALRTEEIKAQAAKDGVAPPRLADPKVARAGLAAEKEAKVLEMLAKGGG